MMILKLWFQISLARAVYSNVAEYPEELCFEAGDILRVLSEDSGLHFFFSNPSSSFQN